MARARSTSVSKLMAQLAAMIAVGGGTGREGSSTLIRLMPKEESCDPAETPAPEAAAPMNTGSVGPEATEYCVQDRPSHLMPHLPEPDEDDLDALPPPAPAPGVPRRAGPPRCPPTRTAMPSRRNGNRPQLVLHHRTLRRDQPRQAPNPPSTPRTRNGSTPSTEVLFTPSVGSVRPRDQSVRMPGAWIRSATSVRTASTGASCQLRTG